MEGDSTQHLPAWQTVGDSLAEDQYFRAWCSDHLDAVPVEHLFHAGYLSTVVGFRLDDGRKVVVKLREPSARLVGCVETHRKVFEAGFPCPELISDVLDFRGYAVTVEAHLPGGDALPSTGRDPVSFGCAFADLMEVAPGPGEVASLAPSPPWTNWGPDRVELWPWPDDHDEDLNEIAGPEWIDDAGRQARARLQAADGAAVVGHGDWYTNNVRWHGTQLHVVHDWDSVIADTEPTIVGFAAAVYPTLHAGEEATLDETQGFIDAYQGARNATFDRDGLECCWAAGVWLRAFDAKKQYAKGQPVRSLSETEAGERLRRAGIR